MVNEHLNSNVLIVVMARQHPGESVGSWMMEGFVNKLLETSNNMSWILLPMINIDGVTLGNNRTGVQGFDFNRHWYIDEETNRYHLFPELKGITAFFKRKKKEYARKTKIFIDFHGHSS
jgi:murein tripeptide amidase MpaA